MVLKHYYISNKKGVFKTEKKLQQKTRQQKEKTITNNILKYLNSLDNCRAIKMHSDGIQGAGEPDIFCCYQGNFVIFETKTATGKPTKLQKYVIKKWTQSGATGGIVRSVKDVIYFLDDLNAKLKRREFV